MQAVVYLLPNEDRFLTTANTDFQKNPPLTGKNATY